jgi:hypothetical protein
LRAVLWLLRNPHAPPPYHRGHCRRGNDLWRRGRWACAVSRQACIGKPDQRDAQRRAGAAAGACAASANRGGMAYLLGEPRGVRTPNDDTMVAPGRIYSWPNCVADTKALPRRPGGGLWVHGRPASSRNRECPGRLAGRRHHRRASLNHTCRNLVPAFPQRSPPWLRIEPQRTPSRQRESIRPVSIRFGRP